VRHTRLCVRSTEEIELYRSRDLRPWKRLAPTDDVTAASRPIICRRLHCGVTSVPREYFRCPLDCQTLKRNSKLNDVLSTRCVMNNGYISCRISPKLRKNFDTTNNRSLHNGEGYNDDDDPSNSTAIQQLHLCTSLL